MGKRPSYFTSSEFLDAGSPSNIYVDFVIRKHFASYSFTHFNFQESIWHFILFPIWFAPHIDGSETNKLIWYSWKKIWVTYFGGHFNGPEHQKREWPQFYCFFSQRLYKSQRGTIFGWFVTATKSQFSWAARPFAIPTTSLFLLTKGRLLSSCLLTGIIFK